MNTSKGIYHWKLGDVAMARMSNKVYARVRVIKDEKGLFFDNKGLCIDSIFNVKALCKLHFIRVQSKQSPP